MEFVIAAYGHNNIRSRHASTWQITKEHELTPRGDCIIGVGADYAVKDLPKELKKHLQEGGWISIEIMVNDYTISGKGQGHSELTFQDPVDMVFRQSEYTCERTIAINTTFTAKDLPAPMVTELQNPSTELSLSLRIDPPVEKANQNSTHK